MFYAILLLYTVVSNGNFGTVLTKYLSMSEHVTLLPTLPPISIQQFIYQFN